MIFIFMSLGIKVLHFELSDRSVRDILMYHDALFGQHLVCNDIMIDVCQCRVDTVKINVKKNYTHIFILCSLNIMMHRFANETILNSTTALTIMASKHSRKGSANDKNGITPRIISLIFHFRIHRHIIPFKMASIVSTRQHVTYIDTF